MTKFDNIWQDQVRFIRYDRIWQDPTRINEIWQESTRIDKNQQDLVWFYNNNDNKPNLRRALLRRICTALKSMKSELESSEKKLVISEIF